MLILLYFVLVLDGFDAIDFYDDDDTTLKFQIKTIEDIDFEPMIPQIKGKEKIIIGKNINCNDFFNYAINCTIEAALIYNSTRKSPPMPTKIGDWCRAIRHLTNCAMDWNVDCQDVTENLFNGDSIKGHVHVLNNVCEDNWFLKRYNDLPQCIENAAKDWETCYTTFQAAVDDQKNRTREWTHFETHFYLCCARAKFRRCTLTTLFETTPTCSYNQSVILQKFSVIVSEGDVHQDCEHNMLYSNCPGGDPRPSETTLNKLMNTDSSATNIQVNDAFVCAMCILNFYILFLWYNCSFIYLLIVRIIKIIRGRIISSFFIRTQKSCPGM